MVVNDFLFEGKSIVNVLLIYPQQIGVKLSPSTFFKKMGAYAPPLGILYLASVLEKSDHIVDIIDYNAEPFNKSELERKVIFNDVIGISVTTQSLQFTSNLIQTIKEINTRKPIILGGPHCILNQEKTIHDFDTDISVLGEAEYVIDDIVKALCNEQKLSKISNIVYKTKDKVVVNHGNTQISSLDNIPFPARHLVEKYDYGYVNDVKLFRGITTAICTSRGCPYHCKFCSVVSLFPKYYQRSAENVIAEINDIVEDGYKTIIVVDDNFMADKKRLITIMEYIIQNELDLNLIVNGARVDSVNEDVFMLMKEAGVKYISFGIESGNQDVLDYYNKKITLDQVEKTVKLCHKLGFITAGNFILGAKIETKKHFENTIKFAKSLPLDVASFLSLGYIYGSPLWKEEVKKGTISPEETMVLADKKRGLGQFSIDEIEEYCVKANRRFYNNIPYFYRQLKNMVIRDDLSYKWAGIKMLIN